MEITKLEHAALLLTEGGQQLVIDPGTFTSPITEASRLIGVVITHEHPDHWTPEHLRRILDDFPGIPVLGPAGVAAAAGEEFPVQTVIADERIELGPFRLRFLGGRHAPIHASVPAVDNLAVLVNEQLLHPGDSYFVPEDVEVDTLAVPAGAPWLKIGELIDWILAVRPQRTFPIHETMLSVAGKELQYPRIRWATEQGGGEFFELDPYQRLHI